MTLRPLRRLFPGEAHARLGRVRAIAADLEFVGGVEYRHVHSTTGGAQFGIGPSIDDDLLIVYAEAFDRDADPDDYSLESIIAHERGHQLIERHPRIQKVARGKLSLFGEEIVASVIASLMVSNDDDKQNLLLKAVGELCARHVPTVDSLRMVRTLRYLLESFL